MNEYLRLDNISKAYDGKVAVNSLSLSVPAGAIYGMLGPNGAGKTTTIRMIMDIIAPDSGSIMVGGKKTDGDFKNRVGYLPEERGLYKKMTLVEIITFLAEIKNYNRHKVAQAIDGWLEKMSLGEYKYRKVEELSKGMQQKLQFITTLIHQPDLVILDELFSGLDPLNIELVKEILLNEKRRGTTILFSTHVMEQAEKLCDYICLINHGKKVLDGRLADIKAQFGK
ncbi:MAG: ATP-binding cassette domain-containing protein, partial [candidate division Zixibacteria bacterium]|nr:ATP-binding cassette domain-containing protein [candidate division Zixibacteria bacterium]